MPKEVQEEAKAGDGLAEFNAEFRSLAEVMRIIQQDTLRIDPDYHRAAGIVSDATNMLSAFVVDGGR